MKLYILLLSSAISVVFGQSCDNPLFDILYKATGMPTTPITQGTDGKYCPKFNGQPSCCNAAAGKLLTYVFNGVGERISAYTSYFDLVDSAAIESNPKFAEVKQELGSQADKFVNTVVDAVHGMKKDAVNSMNALFGLFNGAVCLACDPNWKNFYQPSGSLVSLDPLTCSNVYPILNALFNDVDRLKNKLIDEALDLFPSGVTPDRSLVDQAKAVTVCDAIAAAMKGQTSTQIPPHIDCKAFVCDQISYIFQEAAKQGNSSHPTNSSLTMMDHLSSPDFLVSHSLSFVLRDTKKEASVAAPIAPSTVKVQYVKGGYNAYAVGCQATSCPAPIRSSSSLSSIGGLPGLIGIVGGVLVVVVAVVALIVLKNRAKRQVPVNAAVGYARFNN